MSLSADTHNNVCYLLDVSVGIRKRRSKSVAFLRPTLRTDRETDGRLTIAIPRFAQSAPCASRGKKRMRLLTNNY